MSAATINYDEVIDACEWEPYQAPCSTCRLYGASVDCGHCHGTGLTPWTYQRVKRHKTVAEVGAELKGRLGANEYGDVTFPGLEEYLSVMDPGREWPEGRIVVYAVNGSSEGDYVHVEVHSNQDGTRSETLILGKTFQGRDAAWSAARRIADLLGA